MVNTQLWFYCCKSKNQMAPLMKGNRVMFHSWMTFLFFLAKFDRRKQWLCLILSFCFWTAGRHHRLSRRTSPSLTSQVSTLNPQLRSSCVLTVSMLTANQTQLTETRSLVRRRQTRPSIGRICDLHNKYNVLLADRRLALSITSSRASLRPASLDTFHTSVPFSCETNSHITIKRLEMSIQMSKHRWLKNTAVSNDRSLPQPWSTEFLFIFR